MRPRARGSPQWRWAFIDGLGPAVWAGLEEKEAAELRELARGRRCLEIGSAQGYSTIIMAKVARSVVAIDPHTQFHSEPTFRANLIDHGVEDRVAVMVERSDQALPRLYRLGARFDLVFIDGDHMPASVDYDLTYARSLLAPGGTIALHDYLLGPGTFVRPECQKWREPDRLVETLAIYLPGSES